MAGHNDALFGFIVHSSDEDTDPLLKAQSSDGAALSPFDSWLAQRGIKNLLVRMEKHQTNGKIVAE